MIGRRDFITLLGGGVAARGKRTGCAWRVRKKRE
jgi:hypothetical protein